MTTIDKDGRITSFSGTRSELIALKKKLYLERLGRPMTEQEEKIFDMMTDMEMSLFFPLGHTHGKK